MTLTDETKILDDKIKANPAQYNLDREAAKISALSSDELENIWIFDWWVLNSFNEGQSQEVKNILYMISNQEKKI